jgi:KUP system potassium uptake protein
VSFSGANLLKFTDGGWFPLLIGLIIFTIMTTWNKGHELISKQLDDKEKLMSEFLKLVKTEKPHRVPGFAVYLTGQFSKAPATLTTSFKHFNCLHEHIILLSVNTEEFPHVPSANRIHLKILAPKIYQMTIHYGFMGLPDLSRDFQENFLLEKDVIFDP